MKIVSTALVAAAAAQCALALPHVQSISGKGIRDAVRVQASEEGYYQLPNPRTNPEYYERHHEMLAARYSTGPRFERPAWADRLVQGLHSAVSSLDSMANGLGLELLTVSKLFAPLLPTPHGLTFQSDRFRFDAEGEEMSLGKNATALYDPADSGFDYRKDKVRGVNIGNWLLFELWMSPSLANTLNSRVENGNYGDIVDEWTAAQHMSFNSLQSVLTKHYDTWFTEQDMADIAAAGLNHVRLVIPYWAFKEAVGPKAPYYTFNQFAKAKQAVQWAKKYNLKVWIDLHGVPGSQNGYDNSGRSGPIHWANSADYYTRTKVALQKLIDEFTQPAYRGTVTAIEPVNEPAANRNGAVKNLIRQYYPEARDAIRAVNGANTLMAFHDGFLGPKYWEGFFTPNQAKRTVLDVHDYFVYGDAQKNKKDVARIRDVCALEGQITRSQRSYPTVVGEMAFNGPSGDRASDRNLPVGPVKFPSGPNYPYSVKYMAFMARNSATQRYVFEKGSGWIAWSWRNDGSLDWSYKTGLQYGWNPKDLNAKPYGNDPCNGYR